MGLGSLFLQRNALLISLSRPECILYTYDFKTSASFWTALRVAPILSDEVQTFKALITVHKVIKDGYPVVSCYSLKHTGLTRQD